MTEKAAAVATAKNPSLTVLEGGDDGRDDLRHRYTERFGRARWAQVEDLFSEDSAKVLFEESYLEIGAKMLREYGRLYAQAILDGDPAAAFICMNIFGGPQPPGLLDDGEEVEA